MSKKFDVRKYNDESPNLVDASDILANKRELVVSFFHVPSQRSVYFKAFIVSFAESYNANFEEHATFGRTDPIRQYKNTTRVVDMTLDIPAASEGEAFENLGKVSTLEQFLYPSYSSRDVANTLDQAPLIRMKVMNLAQSSWVYTGEGIAGDGVSLKNPKEGYDVYKSTSDAREGLLGVISNLSVDHGMGGDEGVFYKAGVTNTVLPKAIQISLSFAPIHEQTIGWQGDSPMSPLFPYGVSSEDTVIRQPVDFQGKTFNEQVEMEQRNEDNRKANQQIIDNAEARYGGVLGKMRFKRDSRVSKSDNERRSGRAAKNIDIALEAEVLGTDLGFSAFTTYADTLIAEDL